MSNENTGITFVLLSFSNRQYTATTQKVLCNACKQSDVRQKSTLFRPIRLEHLSVVAVLRSFKVFTRSAVEGKSYAAFSRIVSKMVNAKYYLVEYDYNTYEHISTLVQKIDYWYRRNYEIYINFEDAQPICCCVVKNRCLSDNRTCPNNAPYRAHRNNYFNMRNSHRVNYIPCCCDGMRTTYCRKCFYITSSLSYISS